MLDIYRRAVSYFGATKQKLKAIEEMAELSREKVCYQGDERKQ